MKIAKKIFARKFLSYFLFFVLLYTISFVSSLATEHSLDPWYKELTKASWTPPPWVFGPVWTVLYGMIAVAGARFYQAEESKERTIVLLLYAIQLFFNAIWSYFFFYLQNPLLGLIDLALLIFFLAATLFAGFKVSKIAFWLLVPYFLWSLYALTLNGAIVYLNPI